jgi:glycosyltransferase involved in cell wall biosynthesis
VPSPVSRYFGYLFTRKETRFNLFFGRHLNKIPFETWTDLNLIIINELEYLPWKRLSPGEPLEIPIYLDIHEDHTSNVGRGLLETFAFRDYGSWELEKCRDFVRTNARNIQISTVEETIASSYERELAHKIRIVYNAPDPNRLMPQPVEAKKVKLVHHGMGTKGKGIEETIKAMRYLDQRFSLTLILFASPIYKLKLRVIALFLGVLNRVEVRRGVPLDLLPDELNNFDVAVMLFSNLTSGLFNALPNKFFESLHSKLAIVCGPNPAMRKLVESHDCGLTIKTWKAKELARALNSLSSDQIMRYKQAALLAASVLSSVQSKRTFMHILRELRLKPY